MRRPLLSSSCSPYQADVPSAYPLFVTYFETGLVPRFPTAILTSGMMILAFLSLACGVILDTVSHGRREMKRLRYLEFPAPPRHSKSA